MKQLLLAAFLILFTTAIHAQSSKPDTVAYDSWNGTDWISDSREIFTYDASCRRSTILKQQWDETAQTWNNESLSTYNYQSDNYVSEILVQTWDITTSTWNNSSRTVYTYDASFKILSINSQAWDNNTWSDFYVITYTYDSNGFPDSMLIKNTFFGPLENSILSIYTNNSDGTPNLISHQFWVGEWQNSYRETYTYNPDKSVSQLVYENWISNAWQYGSRITYTYNSAGKVLTTLTESSYPSPWVNSSLIINTYDNNNALTNTLNQTWNTIISSWDNLSQTNFANNADGTVHISIRQAWNTTTIAWDNEMQETYNYTTTCTLPLKLLVFIASKNNLDVNLNWQTTEEINTAHFAVQRSTDGINFTNRGTVPAKGTSSTATDYRFTDNIDKLVADKIYYRLQMVDNDGSFAFSKIVPVTLDAYKGNVKAYPNPVKDQVFVLFNMQNATRAELRIVNAAGKAVHSQRITTAQQNNSISVNVSALPKGTYFIQVITDKGVQKTAFIKQ